jgi:predicted lactoylglutathione lyase
MAAQVTLITLGVRDLARATAFYEAVGFERSSVSVEGVVTFFRSDGPALALWSSNELADDAGVSVEGSGFRHCSFAMNLHSEEELQAMYDAFVAAGATPMKPVHEVFFGASSYVADPDGHLWELAYNRDFPFRPDGRLNLPA